MLKTNTPERVLEVCWSQVSSIVYSLTPSLCSGEKGDFIHFLYVLCLRGSTIIVLRLRGSTILTTVSFLKFSWFQGLLGNKPQWLKEWCYLLWARNCKKVVFPKTGTMPCITLKANLIQHPKLRRASHYCGNGCPCPSQFQRFRLSQMLSASSLQQTHCLLWLEELTPVLWHRLHVMLCTILSQMF